MQLVHLASRLYGTPLLIARSKLDVILSVLGSRIGLPDFTAAVPLPAVKTSNRKASSGIAIIPVQGTLVRRSVGLEASSGLTSYPDIRADIDAALADPHIKGILLDLDSPGGEAGGVFALASHIRAANNLKPVWAQVNDSAHSAAYAIASAASRLMLSETAGVGSIGVIALHVDQSVKDANEGLHFRAIYAGHHKNDFSPHAPLSTQAAAALQAEVDRLYGLFTGQVAQLRGLDIESVRAGEAGLFFGEAAITAGLADGISGIENTLEEFSGLLASQRRLAGKHNLMEKMMTEHITRDTPEQPAVQAVAEATQSPASIPPVSAGTSSITGAAAATNEYGAARTIAELCLIAGVPQRTAEFLAAEMTENQVRSALLKARADQIEIDSRITAPTTTETSPEKSSIVTAAKKLANRG